MEFCPGGLGIHLLPFTLHFLLMCRLQVLYKARQSEAHFTNTIKANGKVTRLWGEGGREVRETEMIQAFRKD